MGAHHVTKGHRNSTALATVPTTMPAVCLDTSGSPMVVTEHRRVYKERPELQAELACYRGRAGFPKRFGFFVQKARKRRPQVDFEQIDNGDEGRG